jgi:hypothetical protein
MQSACAEFVWQTAGGSRSRPYLNRRGGAGERWPLTAASTDNPTTSRTTGAAVHDAIVNGFRPDEDHWAIESTHLITHFAPGQRSVDVSKNDNAKLVPPRGRASFPAAIKGEGHLIGGPQLVEAAGIEPASASPTQSGLHA